jgi:hypothetical protein
VNFESTRLRLASGLGVMTPTDILQQILALAASSDETMRVEAALASAGVAFANESVGLAIVLLLSRDADARVRVAACRALLSRPWGGSEADVLVWPRVIELLSEGGREPTLGVLLGLFDGVVSGVEPTAAIRSRIRILATDHVSWSVRTMATRLAGRWQSGGAANS